MAPRPLSVAWISFFPLEWLPDAPEPLRRIPRRHPASWQRVLVDELAHTPNLALHIFAVRSHYPRGLSFKRGNANFYCVNVPYGMRTFSLFWWETILLRRALERVKPDLVHAWGTERGAALVASRLRYPTLVTMQGLLQWYLENADLGHFVRQEAKLERLSLRRSSFVTAESKFAMNWLGSHYPHLKLRQVEHAPNWLFHQLKRKPVTKPLQFLFVGTLGPLKGADLLMQGLDALKDELDFRLTIVGSHRQGYLKHLSAITSKALWQGVSLLSNLTQEQVAEQMARATILLFPTRADNSPNAVKEAVVCGLPVVGSAVGGILDYVLPGQNGLTFRGGDLDAFIGAIRTAVAHPLFGQGKVDQETLAQMRAYLSPARMAEGFLNAYREVSESALLESEPNIDAGRALG